MISKPIVLVLEDDKSISLVMKMVLENEGFDVRQADNCSDAIQIVKKTHIKCVLVDYLLHDGTADEFVHYIQSAHSSIPILLVTARSQSEALAQSLKIKNLIKKPFDLDTLINAVRSAIR